MDDALGIGVDAHRHRLAGAHGVELGLLEVGGDPDVVGHEHGQVRPRLDELADAGGEVDDAAGLGGANDRVGEIELRLVSLGPGLREGRDRVLALRLQRDDLPLRDFQLGLGGVERRALLQQFEPYCCAFCTLPAPVRARSL